MMQQVMLPVNNTTICGWVVVHVVCGHHVKSSEGMHNIVVWGGVVLLNGVLSYVNY